MCAMPNEVRSSFDQIDSNVCTRVQAQSARTATPRAAAPAKTFTAALFFAPDEEESEAAAVEVDEAELDPEVVLALAEPDADEDAAAVEDEAGVEVRVTP